MNKMAITIFSMLSAVQANAYQLNIKSSGLPAGTKFGYVVDAEKLVKNPNGNTSYESTHDAVDGLDIKLLNKYITKLNKKSSKDTTLSNFTFILNGKTPANCSHLEKKAGNSPQRVSSIVTVKGCQ